MKCDQNRSEQKLQVNTPIVLKQSQNYKRYAYLQSFYISMKMLSLVYSSPFNHFGFNKILQVKMKAEYVSEDQNGKNHHEITSMK